MKSLTPVILFLLLFNTLSSAQFNWSSNLVADGSNLQKMVVIDDNTAVIAGLNFAIKQTTNASASWNDVNLPDTIANLPDVDYYDLKGRGDTLLLCYKKVKLEENGTHDTYSNSNILFSGDKGANWTIMDYSGIGDGSNNPASDAFADSCYGVSVVSLDMDMDKNIYIHASWDEKDGDSKTTHAYIYKSEDFGESWSVELPVDLGSTYIKTISFFENGGFIGGNKIIHYMNSGNEWTDISSDLITANSDDDSYYINNVVPAMGGHFILITTSDGLFDFDSSTGTITKLPFFPGANDIFYLGSENILSVGSDSKTVLSRDFGNTIESAAVSGVTLFDAGGIMNDSIYALGKGYVYTIAIKELNLVDAVDDVIVNKALNLIKVAYNRYNLKALNNGSYQMYTLNGKLIDNANFNRGRNVLELNSLNKGIYILRAIDSQNNVSTYKVFIQ